MNQPQSQHLRTNCFALFSTCFITKGSQRSIILDWNRNRSKLIPNVLADFFDGKHYVDVTAVIADLENEEQVSIVNEYFQFLEEYEYGTWTNTPEHFKPYSLEYEFPSNIHNSIIDISKHSNFDLEDVISQLEALTCKFLQIRVLDEYAAAALYRILAATQGTSFSSIELVIPYTLCDTEQKLGNFFGGYDKVHKAYIYASPFEEVKDYGAGQVIYTSIDFTPASHCGFISTSHFRIEKDFILESLQHNNCLHHKISVDDRDNIKNCPSMPKKLWTYQRGLFESNPEFGRIQGKMVPE